MPISLQASKTPVGILVGGTTYFSETEESLIVSGGMTFLKSGYASIGEQSLYPDAYARFDNFVTPVPSPFPNRNYQSTSDSSVFIRGVKYINGAYFAMAYTTLSYTANSGWIASSPDGVNWTVVSKTRYSGYTINYINGRYVLGGFDGVASPTTQGIWSSTDLVTWTLVASRFNTSSYQVYDSVSNGTALAVVGAQGTIVVTTNGTSATSFFGFQSSGATFPSIAYGGGVFVTPSALGIVYSTNNGTSWTNVIPSGYNSTVMGQSPYVVYGNGQFIIAGASLWWRSTNGTTWTSFTPPTTIAASFPGTYCSKYGFVFSNNNSSFVISVDGVTWELITISGGDAGGNISSNGVDFVVTNSNSNSSSSMSTSVQSVGLLAEDIGPSGRLYMRIK